MPVQVVDNHVVYRAGPQDTHPQTGADVYLLTEKLNGVSSSITDHTHFTAHSISPGLIAQILMAFTHWTLEFHAGTALVCGFRGVGTVLTEAVIYDIE